MRHSRIAPVALLLLPLITVSFCRGQKGPARLVLTPKNALLQPAQTQQLNAQRAYLGGVAQGGVFSGAVGPLVWSSSNSAIAGVDSTGLVTAVSAGTAVITTRSGPFSGSTKVIVTSNALSAICVSPLSASVNAGFTQQFSATGVFGSGGCPASTDITASVTWSSANVGIATVSNAAGSEGLAKGLTPGGPINITAAYGGVNASASLTVNPAMLVSIMVTPNPANIPNIGTAQPFTATGSYSDGINRMIPNTLTPSVSWTSSNPSIATVASNGVATAVAQNKTTITATDPVTSVSGSSVLTVGPVNATTFYVAPNGSDNSYSGMLPAPNGSGDGPFASPARAQLAVENTAKGNPIFVMLRNGTYYLPLSPTKPGTLTLNNPTDSGAASNAVVTWENYPNETPIVSGGVPIGARLGLTWNNVSGNLWQVQLPANVQTNVPLQYFEDLFYNGQRRLRPRLTNSNNYLGTYFRFAGPVYVNAPGPPSPAPSANCSVYIAGSGWECFDRFLYNPADPIQSTWQNLAPPAGNPCNQTAGNPNLTGDIELLDFEYFTAPKLRVSCVDTTNHIVYLTGPTAIQQGNSNHGFIPNHRYLLENIKDALTQQGQWFLDRSTAPWTLSYLTNNSETPNTDTVVVPQLTQLLVASGLQYVTFRGIIFAHGSYTVAATGHVSLQQEATINTAVSCQNCQNVTFDTDTVTQTSGGGLEVISCINSLSPSWCLSSSTSAVTANNTIQNSAFYDLGAMGIRVGVPNLSADTDSNVPQFTTVQNNVIEGYGRVFPAAFGISQGDGHDNTYTHNDVYDGYHAAISVCSPPCGPGKSNSNGAFNNIISFNHVYNLIQGIMDDGGSLYFATGGPNFAAAGNKMLNNKVHDVNDASTQDADGYGGNGLYLDNQAGQVDVENNLVYRVSGTPMFITQAPPVTNEPHIIKNNIFAYGRLGIVTDGNPYPSGSVPPSPNLVFNLSNNLFYFDRNTNSNPAFYLQRGCTYSGGYPYTQFQNWTSNLYWRTDGGFGSDNHAFHVQPNPGTNSLCGGPPSWMYYTFAAWQQNFGEDVQSVVQNPGFANPTYPADDYSLPGGSPGVGFVVFDPSQAGRANLVINPPMVPASFPTALFNPATDF